MENKYYIPDISDIKIGYECEINSKIVNKIDKWSPYIVGEGYENITIARALSEVISGGIRTPYLTKEQLEAEGWEHVGGQLLSVGRQEFTKTIIYIDGIKRELELDYTFTSKILNISYDCGEIVPIGLFNGYCPSINEFKYIIKLLQIK